MKFMRTPDSRFEGLEGYDFFPYQRDVSSGDGGVLRVHYIDEDPAEAVPILLMHGGTTGRICGVR